MLNTMVCENCTNILNNFKKVCCNCNFVRKYRDKTGNVYFVKKSDFTKMFTVFVISTRNNKETEYDKASRHYSYAEAQSELNAMARERRWKVYDTIVFENRSAVG